jgi:lipopolysaccharide assembly outer membrane protein LptD (OstA)
MTSRLLVCFVFAATLGVAAAEAQVPGYNSKQFRIEQIDEGHWRFTGQVELENEEVAGQKFYANVVDLYTDNDRVEATGNVVYETATARVAAERAVFFTRAGTGTFYNASGLASLGEKADRSMFGALEPDVYFYGEVLEKTGEDRYKITKGGFTTCVQPTPRWELVSGSARINVGDYALLSNAVMRVKDVPIFYLPWMYYPIQDDDRSTGFLLPSYGRSLYQGSSVSNAFFWAISRSQDLTVMHDWFTQTGQGYGTEYRWMRSGTSLGNLRAYKLAQKAATVNGAPVPESRSVLVNGAITQDLPFRLKGRARIDYSSNLTLNQLYSQDIYNATQSISTWNGNVSGSWRFLNASATAQRTQQFFNETQSRINGSLPSVTAAVSSRKLGPLPVYFALQSEAARPIYIERNGDSDLDRSLTRTDVLPSLRMPLSRWPFLNMNLQLSYRNTWYSESMEQVPGTVNFVQVEVPYTRNYGELRAEILGPVFSKVYTPNNVFADRLKHVIEPSFAIQRTTNIEDFLRVPTLGSSYDRVVGDVTRVTYGLMNRVLVRKAPPKGSAAAPAASAPRELLTAGISQTYYTNPLASSYDPTYQSSYIDLPGGRPPSNFSPVAVNVRSQPFTMVGATFRTEYDWPQRKLLSMSTGTDYGSPERTVAVAWSRSLSSYFPTNTLNGQARLTFMGGRLGTNYSAHWDIQRDTLVQQRIVAFYNAQCCGIVMQLQEYSFGSYGGGTPIPKDRRFNLAFTLAGIGTFSNFFGNFGGSGY